MFWNHARILILYTGGFMLFPSNTEKRMDFSDRREDLPHMESRPVPANAGLPGKGDGRDGAAVAGKNAGSGGAVSGTGQVSDGATSGSGLSKKSALHWQEGDPYCIYMTFDDGPSAGSQVVNELSLEDSLSINVFLIGRNACLTQRSRTLVNDYRANPLVEIGNHSFTHANRKYEHFFEEPETVLADFDRSRDSLQLQNGLTRLPGRNFFRLEGIIRDDHNNGREAADTLAVHGYRVVGWDLEWRRRAGKGFVLHTGEGMLDIVRNMLEKQKTFLPGHIVILLHDQDFRDEHFKSEVEDFIRLARADGRYHFDHLSELTGDGTN